MSLCERNLFCSLTKLCGLWERGVNAKYSSRLPRNRNTILNVKVILYPGKASSLVCKIGRLSVINIELNLFQELESAVHGSDSHTMLIGLSRWTFIFWWSLIRTHLDRESCLLTPGWYGFAHALGSGQVVGWRTCANCCHVCYDRRRTTQLDTFRPFPVMGCFHRNNCAIACDTRAQFWWGRARRINKQKGVGNYLH